MTAWKPPERVYPDWAGEMWVRSGGEDSLPIKLIPEATAQERERVLREALERYGDHLHDCQYTPPDSCTCGLDALLAALASKGGGDA